MHWSELLHLDHKEVRDICSDINAPFTRKNLEDALIAEFKGQARPKMLRVLRAAERNKHYRDWMKMGVVLERDEEEDRPRIKGDRPVIPVISKNGLLQLEYNL